MAAEITASLADERPFDAHSLENAARRLSAALDALEAAVERRTQADRAEASLSAQVHALGIDRSRLAAQLDQQTARTRRLESANREVSHRLDHALDAVRTVLDGQKR